MGTVERKRSSQTTDESKPDKKERS